MSHLGYLLLTAPEDCPPPSPPNYMFWKFNQLDENDHPVLSGTRDPLNLTTLSFSDGGLTGNILFELAALLPDYNGRPFIKVFPDGLEYYLAAGLDQVLQRYGELIQRATANLAADDAVVVTHLPALQAALDRWQAATEALRVAESDRSMRASELADATEAWEKRMIDTHADLVKQVGKAKAERYFRRPKRKPAAKDGAGGATDG